METEFARFFVSLVNELIHDDGGKEKLFEALRQYKSSQVLDELISDLRSVLDEPSKLELYEYLRPLVLLHHQLEFSQRVPYRPGVKLRTVRLHRKAGGSLGFGVRGGYEHGVGIFVTHLTPGSQADRQGLRVGDEIVRVNGFTISEAIHDDVLNLIKSRDDIVLRVTHIGMIPVKEQASMPVKWKYIDERNGLQQINADGYNENNKKHRDLKIFVDTTGYTSFGCGILSGPKSYPGIFIEKVRPGSLADEVGLEVGDQIVEVNETNFKNITHEQAVLAMKSSRQLTIIIRQQMGLRLFNQLANQQSSNINRRINNSANGSNVNSTSGNRPSTQNQDLRQIQTDSANHRSSYSSSNQSASDSRPTSEEMKEEALDESRLIAHQLEQQSLGGRLWQTGKNEDKQAFSTSQFYTATDKYSDLRSNEKQQEEEILNEKTSPGGSSNYSSEIREELQDRKKFLQSSPLSGAAAVAAQQRLQGSVKPGLLGIGDSFSFIEDVPLTSYDMFTSSELEGRPLRAIRFNKTDDLGVGLEGGLGSPLAGKVIVSLVFDDGIAKKSGKMRVGDQLMAVNGQRLLDITVAKAEAMIHNVTKDNVELLFCESTLVNEEDSMTYF